MVKKLLENKYIIIASQINALDILLDAHKNKSVKFPDKYATLIGVFELRKTLKSKMATLLEKIE